MLPLSAVRTQVFVSPSMLICSSGQRAYTAKALPERCWQAKQWQTETRTGSPVQVTVSWPQRQEAVRVVMTASIGRCPGEEAVGGGLGDAGH